MSKTRAELVDRALQKLRVVGAGQTASAEDVQLVDNIVHPIMSELSARGFFQWGDEDAIDEAAFEHLADIIANASAPDFGQAPDEGVRVMAERRLRMLQPFFVSGQPVKSEYF